MKKIVTIKFRTAGKHYDFNAKDLPMNKGDRVIVETDRGRALGIVVSPPEDRDPGNVPKGLKSVLRQATDEDLAMAAANSAREQTALRYCRERIRDRKMEMKLIKAEYLFDGSKIIFYFTADGRVDFRELVKDLAHHFHTRIEMRQIGVRDEAKLIGGIGVCGRTLCCCSHMTDFAPVSVKMAKEQQLALNPNKISGQCGRLLCCLGYEYETYCKQRKGMPKNGLKLTVEGQNAQVVDIDILRQRITLRVADGRSFKLSKEEFSALQKPDATLPQPDLPQAAPSRPDSTSGAEKSDKEGKGRSSRSRRRSRTGKKPEKQGEGGQSRPASDKQEKGQQGSKPKPPQDKAKKPQGPPQGEKDEAAAPQKRRRRRRNRRRPGNKPEGNAE